MRAGVAVTARTTSANGIPSANSLLMVRDNEMA